MKDGKRVGLALSGGGYRAAAFHLGTMRKLHQLNILEKVDVFSTISGGSITGAAYCMKDTDYPAFEKWMVGTLTKKSVIRYVLSSFAFLRTLLFLLVFLGGSVYVLFTPYPWASPILLIIMTILFFLFQYKLFPVSKVIEKAYDRYFFKSKTLSQLADHPAIAIGSTNIQTCRPFSFSKNRMGDSAYTYHKPPVIFKHREFPVSKAVMASSCVPFAFAPVLIESKYYQHPEQAAEFKPVLVDGGVYDNQGIHKLTESKSSYLCDIIISSDAGSKPPFKRSFNNVIILLIRTMDVFMARIKDFQIVTNVYRNTRSGTNREITYVSLGWDLSRLIPGFVSNLAQGNIAPSVLACHKIPEELLDNIQENQAAIRAYLETKLNYAAMEKDIVNEADLLCARSVGTNLTKLSIRQVDCLSRHAANITELQVKLYCPSLI